MDQLTFRVLPPEEWDKLVHDGVEPWVTYGLPDPDHFMLIVAELDGRIIGVSSLQEVVLNHWWVNPEARRRSPGVIEGLWQTTEEQLRAHQVDFVHATVPNAQPEVQEMVERLGYIEADGRLYLLDVARCILNKKE